MLNGQIVTFRAITFCSTGLGILPEIFPTFFNSFGLVSSTGIGTAIFPTCFNSLGAAAFYGLWFYYKFTQTYTAHILFTRLRQFTVYSLQFSSQSHKQAITQHTVTIKIPSPLSSTLTPKVSRPIIPPPCCNLYCDL